MSGIFGIFYKDGQPVEKQTLRAMQQAMEEWGPDGSQVWADGQIGLGHLFMRNLPKPFDQQPPLRDPTDDQLIISADARIDHRDELCDLLNIPQNERRLLSDCRLISAAYKKWGADCPKYFIGAYAFAIWDRQKHLLTLVRDHIGFRPLYIYNDAKKFIFASDIRAILAIDAVPQQLDLDAIAATRAHYTQYLLKNTLYTDIKKLRPARTISVSKGHLKERAYWHPQEISRVRLNSNEEYAEQLKSLIEEAVACRLHSPYPIGSHLSGGLDSSAVTVLAARQLRAAGSRLAGAYTWSPQPTAQDYPLGDERQHIEKVCQSEQINCHYSTMTPADVIEMWQEDLRQKPQITTYNEPKLRQQASQQGVRVLLSGWGGDEFATSHGAGYYSEHLMKMRICKLLNELRLTNQVVGGSLKNFVQHEVLSPLLPYLFAKRWQNSGIQELIHDPQMRERTSYFLRRMMKEHRASPSVATNLQKPFQLGWLTYRMECWVAHGTSHQIDYRYPLLDRRVVEYCLGLPNEQFVQNGWMRFIFRNAMHGLLPDSICWNHANKQESARQAANRSIVKSAREIFIAQLNSGQIQISGVSSMWQDRLLPI